MDAKSKSFSDDDETTVFIPDIFALGEGCKSRSRPVCGFHWCGRGVVAVVRRSVLPISNEAALCRIQIWDVMNLNYAFPYSF